MTTKAFIIVGCVMLLAVSEWFFGIIQFDLVGMRHLILIFTALALAIVCNSSNVLSRGYYLGALVVIAAGFFGSIGQPTPWINRILGAAFTIFPFLIFMLSSRVTIGENTTISILKGLSLFCLLTGVYPVALHIPELPQAMRWQFGVFREVGAFASIMNIGVAAALTVSFSKRSSLFFWLAVLLSLFVMMTILKKSIVSNLLVWFVFAYVNGVPKKTLGFAALLPLFMSFFWGAIQDNIGENLDYIENVGVEGHVRLAMYLGSLQIAAENFPFGSGFGSFGSLASIFNWYSPLYSMYGVSAVGANSEADVLAGHHTLLDTFWPHIIGELGVVGAAAYFFLCAVPIRYCFAFARSDNAGGIFRQVGLFVVAVNSAILWEGLTLYNPETPVFMAFTSLIGGLFYRFCLDSGLRISAYEPRGERDMFAPRKLSKRRMLLLK
jgi:hypothetical protein